MKSTWSVIIVIFFTSLTLLSCNNSANKPDDIRLNELTTPCDYVYALQTAVQAVAELGSSRPIRSDWSPEDSKLVEEWAQKIKDIDEACPFKMTQAQMRECNFDSLSLVTDLEKFRKITSLIRQPLIDAAATAAEQAAADSVAAAAAADSAAAAAATADESNRISPQEDQSGLGVICFNKNSQTLFYYDSTTGKGKIIIDGQEYVFGVFQRGKDRMDLYGGGVSIRCYNIKYEENDGESDCAYGTCSAGDYGSCRIRSKSGRA